MDAVEIPGPVLKELLASKGWSQRKLAKELGTTPGNVSRWVTGKWSPQARAMHIAARFLLENPEAKASQSAGQAA